MRGRAHDVVDDVTVGREAFVLQKRLDGVGGDLGDLRGQERRGFADLAAEGAGLGLGRVGRLVAGVGVLALIRPHNRVFAGLLNLVEEIECVGQDIRALSQATLIGLQLGQHLCFIYNTNRKSC